MAIEMVKVKASKKIKVYAQKRARDEGILEWTEYVSIAIDEAKLVED